MNQIIQTTQQTADTQTEIKIAISAQEVTVKTRTLDRKRNLVCTRSTVVPIISADDVKDLPDTGKLPDHLETQLKNSE